MVSKGQMTGMRGVFLVASELTREGLIVSITSRNADGADLLATNMDYTKAWSIQVKTNSKAPSFWLVGNIHPSPTHIYIFVNLNNGKTPDYYVVPSKQVAKLSHSKDARFLAFWRKDAERFHNSWLAFKANQISN